MPRGGAHTIPGADGGRGLFEEQEEKRKVTEISCEHAVDTFPLCETCAQKVAAELKVAHVLAQDDYEMYTRLYESLCEELKDVQDETDEDRRALLLQAEQEEQVHVYKRMGGKETETKTRA